MRRPAAALNQLATATCLAWLLQYYYLRWDVYLRGERIGEVLAPTEQAARLRAIHKFRIEKKDQSELEVRRARNSYLDASATRGQASGDWNTNARANLTLAKLYTSGGLFTKGMGAITIGESGGT